MNGVPAPTRPSAVRLIVGYAAVVAALPYLVLKVVWLSGSTVGFTDPAVARDSGLYVLNVVTAGLDAGAVLVALTLTHGWGMRVPAWLVAFPMWVGTGFLAPIVVVAPLTVLFTMFTDRSAAGSAGIVEPWVYGLVYAGFVGEGAALMVAFVLYARTRWPALFGTRVGESRPGATHRLQVVLAVASAVLAAALGATHMAWAFGIGAGLPPRVLRSRDLAGSLVDGATGLLALAAVVGLLMIVLRLGRGIRFWVPLVLVWTGAGAMFSWGIWGTVNAVSASVLTGSGDGLAVVRLVGFGRALAGLLIGVVVAFILAERDAAVPWAVPSRARSPVALQ